MFGTDRDFSMREYKRLIQAVIDAFKAIEVVQVKKPRVGIVGEILVKFHPYANNQLIDIIEQKAAKQSFLTSSTSSYTACTIASLKWSTTACPTSILPSARSQRNISNSIAVRFAKLCWPAGACKRAQDEEIAGKAERILGLGHQMGEGWLLPGEIVERIDAGVENVVCVQPFGSLPNDVVGRGMFNAIKKEYPNANLLSIDYDAGISKVNQINRIKLMISVAKKRLQSEQVV